MAKTRVVRKGGSLPFQFDRGGESISGWICTINVKQLPTDVASISRVITPTNNVWSGFLTSTETDALSNATGNSLWWLVGILTNASTGEEEQIASGSVRFNLTQSWN